MASASGIRAGRAYVELGADGSKLNAALRKAETDLKAFGKKTSEIGASILKVGAISAAPMALAARTFAGFDDQMRIVQAVTQATGKQFEALTEQAKELGRTTSFTAAQVAEGMTELGRAGFSASEIQSSISGVMNLARATATEVPMEKEIASGELREFNMDASEMSKVCDVLAVAANGSAQTLEDMGEALKYVAPLAAQAGMNIQDTAKVIGALANFSIKGSQAGTTFKNILTRMADPTVQKRFADLGVATVDAAGNLRNVSQVMQELGQATRDLPNAQRLAVFADLFDMRAMAGGAALSGAQFVEFFDAVDNAVGKASSIASEMDKGVGGSFRTLTSAIEGAAIALGSSMAPTLTDLADNIRSVTSQVTEWISENQRTIENIMQTVKAATVLGVEILAVGKALQVASEGAKILRVVLASSLGPWGVLLATVTAVSTALTSRYITANVKATASARDATDAIKAQAEAHRASEAEHQAALKRLQELSAQQILTDNEMEEASKLVETLTDAYGDLGIKLDETTRKLSVATDAQSKLNEAQKQAQINDIKLLDQKLANENAQIEQELKSLGGAQGVWREMGARLGMNKSIEARMNELYARQGEILTERRNLKERRDIIEGVEREEAKPAETATETATEVKAAFTNEMRASADEFGKRISSHVDVNLAGDLESQRTAIESAFENFMKVQKIKLDAGAISDEEYAGSTQKARNWTQSALEQIENQQTTNEERQERTAERSERQNERDTAIADAQSAILAAQKDLMTALTTGNGIADAQAALDAAQEMFENEKAKAAEGRAADAQERLADAQTALTEAQKVGNQELIDAAQSELAAAQSEVVSANSDLKAAIENALETNADMIETSFASSGTFDAFEALDMAQDWQRDEMKRQTTILDRIKIATEKTAKDVEDDGDLI